MREAVIDLTDEELQAIGYGDLVTICREAGIREIELLEDEGTRSVPQIEVASRLDGDRLDALECVEDWTLVSRTDEGFRYVIEVRALEMPDGTAEAHEDLIGMCDPTTTEEGVLLSLVGDQETIRAVLRNFEDAGVVPDLHSLGEYEGGRRTLEALTDRQLEVLRTAYDMGFYAVPRETSVEEVAAQFDLDSGTVSEHLQRAERNILTQQLTA